MCKIVTAPAGTSCCSRLQFRRYYYNSVADSITSVPLKLTQLTPAVTESSSTGSCSIVTVAAFIGSPQSAEPTKSDQPAVSVTATCPSQAATACRIQSKKLLNLLQFS
jgi:hypothetical protein